MIWEFNKGKTKFVNIYQLVTIKMNTQQELLGGGLFNNSKVIRKLSLQKFKTLINKKLEFKQILNKKMKFKKIINKKLKLKKLKLKKLKIKNQKI